MKLGERIAAWRRYFKLTQPQLAERVGVGVSTVSMWETNQNPPRHDNLTALVEAFGITLERFYGPLPSLPKAA